MFTCFSCQVIAAAAANVAQFCVWVVLVFDSHPLGYFVRPQFPAGVGVEFVTERHRSASFPQFRA